MGVRNVLIEGVSGTGKTTVATELERRGYHVIHGDRGFAYYGDPETGEPVSGPPAHEADPLGWLYDRWIWPLDKVRSIMADPTHPITFFCGGARNAHQIIDLFDAIFVLDVDLDTLNRRLDLRPDDEYGREPEQRRVVLRAHATRRGLPETGTFIDATRPVGEVVDDILGRCGL